MSYLTGKIIEAHSDPDGCGDFVLGMRLKALREVTRTSQIELAGKLGISRSALARLEKKADIQVSIVRRYVEALGASLKINAEFAPSSVTALRIAEAFDVDFIDESQLVLPIFGDEDFRHQRDVVLSIKPQYSTKILKGEKTVELRRRFPVNVPAGTLAFIYSTTPDKALVGFAEIRMVSKSKVADIWKQFKSEACITKEDFDAYFSGQEFGFALQFRRAKRFKEAIDLADLRERFGFEPPQSFLYAKPLLREALRYELSELSH